MVWRGLNRAIQRDTIFRFIAFLCTRSVAVVSWSNPHPVSIRHRANLCPSNIPSCGTFIFDRKCRYSVLCYSKMDSEMSGETRLTTLADQYLVEISNNSPTIWSLFPITQVVDGMDIIAEGAQAKKALSTETSLSPAAVLKCDCMEPGVLRVTTVNHSGKINEDLLASLSRILVQWAASHESIEEASEWKVLFGDNDSLPAIHDFASENDLRNLFADVANTAVAIEWVEMVTGTGHILGRVPRRLVHSFNLLHRGIGMFVTKDKPTQIIGDDFPPLYVHRRTDTKRIFPSLYDMFVGGVSLAGEAAELTARREVAEELGLPRALDESVALTGPLLDCIICTSYNRCLVSLFSYTMDSKLESVSWQEEEVAWGDFVPYNIVAVAADLSIQRLAEMQDWPGTYPPIQSNLNSQGVAPYEVEDWAAWDFVPDGLLVWEAWLNWLQKQPKSAS
jgi:8-oxo-dGTP pyrophosphatase MutT (NUDIX family)